MERGGRGTEGGAGQVGTVRGSQAGRRYHAGRVPTIATPSNGVDSPTRTGEREGSQGIMAGRDGGPTEPGKHDREGGVRFPVDVVDARGGHVVRAIDGSIPN